MIAALWLALALQAMPTSPIRAGWEAIQRGDGDAAARSFRQALSENPHSADALTGAAYAAHLQANDDEAIRLLKKALVERPDDVQAAYLLGPIAYGQGDLDLAIKSWERVVKLAPGSRDIYQTLEGWKKESALHDTFASRPSARFNVMFEGPAQADIAARVLATLEAAYARVGQSLNAYPPETVTAILYTKQQFQDITHAPGWAAAAYDGRIRIPVLGALENPAELDRVVTHEYVHAVVRSTTPRLPVWMHEGLATYEEGDAHHGWLLTGLRTSRQRIALADLDRAFEGDGATALVAYAESLVLTRLLFERLGAANMPIFLQYISNGTPIDQALLLFNVQQTQLEQDFSRRLATR